MLYYNTMWLLYAVCASILLQSVTAQCPTPEWKFRSGYCYLFQMDNNEDINTWDDALSLCKSFYSNASLVTLQNTDEHQYVHSTMLSETVPSVETNTWIGMYKEGFGFPYIWENGEEVVYTNWAPGEPNDQDGTQNCVRMYGGILDGQWDDYFCDNAFDDTFIGHGYVCKIESEIPEVVLPQHEFTISGNFTSTTGGDFTPTCTLAYADSMNTRANSMTETVNGLIGSDLCSGMTTNHMMLSTVSAPLITTGNMGSTSHFYIAELGVNVSLGQVDNCSLEISDFISVHTNWDPTGEVLPPEEGCPGVQFTEESFTRTGSQWLCLDTAVNFGLPAELAEEIMFSLAHSGIFQSTDGSDISSSCLLAYNNRFLVDTLALAQSVNQMIGESLCQGKNMDINSATASLVLSGNQQGASIQTYELQPGLDNTFNDVQSCSYEVSSYLSDHNNWDSLLPPIEGCPQLSFTTSFFSLGETQWSCV